MRSPAQHDPIALAIADSALRSVAALEHIREILLDIASSERDEPSPKLRDFLDKIHGVLAQLIRLWQHQPTEAFLRHAMMVEAVLEAAHNGYLRLASESGITAIERGRRSKVALLLGDALCTVRTGIPGVVSVRDSRQLRGSANCASTGGGGSPSQHRHTNVLAKMWDVNAQGMGISLSSTAQALAYSLRVDPVMVSGVDGVVDALYGVGRGIGLMK